MSLREKAVGAWLKSLKENEELKKRLMEEEKERTKETLIKALKRILNVNPENVELHLLKEDDKIDPLQQIYWEAIVDGLRFRYFKGVASHGLHVAWDCINKCGNVVWYEVNSLQHLGALLTDDRCLLPCFDCSCKEMKKYEEEEYEHAKPQEAKICPLLNKECLQEKCAWFDQSTCGILTLDP